MYPHVTTKTKQEWKDLEIYAKTRKSIVNMQNISSALLLSPNLKTKSLGITAKRKD